MERQPVPVSRDCLTRDFQMGGCVHRTDGDCRTRGLWMGGRVGLMGLMGTDRHVIHGYGHGTCAGMCMRPCIEILLCCVMGRVRGMPRKSGRNLSSNLRYAEGEKRVTGNGLHNLAHVMFLRHQRGSMA